MTLLYRATRPLVIPPRTNFWHEKKKPRRYITATSVAEAALFAHLPQRSYPAGGTVVKMEGLSPVQFPSQPKLPALMATAAAVANAEWISQPRQFFGQQNSKCTEIPMVGDFKVKPALLVLCDSNSNTASVAPTAKSHCPSAQQSAPQSAPQSDPKSQKSADCAKSSVAVDRPQRGGASSFAPADAIPVLGATRDSRNRIGSGDAPSTAAAAANCDTKKARSQYEGKRQCDFRGLRGDRDFQAQSEPLAVVPAICFVFNQLSAEKELHKELVDGKLPKKAPSKFHSLIEPSFTIQTYLESLQETADISAECFILAIIYVDRLLARYPTKISLNVFTVNRCV